jgi:predicted Zn-dependent peptidase
VRTRRLSSKKYYHLSNLVSVIVGDVDPKRMHALTETYFERIPSGPKPEPLRTVEPPPEGEYRVTLRLQSERFVLMGYQKPDGNHPDDAVFQALNGILSEGRSRVSMAVRCAIKDRRAGLRLPRTDRGGSTPVCSPS